MIFHSKAGRAKNLFRSQTKYVMVPNKKKYLTSCTRLHLRIKSIDNKKWVNVVAMSRVTRSSAVVKPQREPVYYKKWYSPYLFPAQGDFS